MSKWVLQKAAEFCASVRDGTHDSPKSVEGGGKPLVTSKVVKQGVVRVEDAYLISEKDYRKINERSKVDRWDILMTMIGTVGECAIVKDDPDYAIKNIALFKMAGDEEKSKWLYYYLTSPTGQGALRGNFRGSSQQYISLDQLRNLEVPVPEKDVRSRIVAILSDYDSAIDNARRQIALLEEAAMRLYREWFVVKANPKWEKKRIVDVCVKIGAGGTPNRRQEKYWLNGTIAWIKTKELQDCWLFDSEEKITPAGLDGSSAKIYPENTVVMAIYASPTLGRLGIFDKPMCCNQAALCLVADESQVSWEWLYCQLFELRDEFNRIARGAGQQNISGEVVKETVVRIPDVHAMFEFTNAARPLFSQCRILGRQIGNLTEARDRLLPKLMSGEIEV